MHIPYYICSMKVETRHYSYIITDEFDRTSFDTGENVCRDLQNSRSFNGVFFYRQHHVFDSTMTDNFQYQSQFVDTENTTP